MKCVVSTFAQLVAIVANYIRMSNRLYVFDIVKVTSSHSVSVSVIPVSYNDCNPIPIMADQVVRRT